MEFALIVPIMLLILLMIVDFGLAMDRRVLLQHAVREGARLGATGANAMEITEVTADQAGMDPGAIIVTVCYLDMDLDGDAGELGESVRVGAIVTHRFTTGGNEILSAFGVPAIEIEMTPVADMRLEQRVTGGTAC